jgi:hypothetical protein
MVIDETGKSVEEHRGVLEMQRMSAALKDFEAGIRA